MLTDNLVLVLMGFIGIIILILVLWQPYLGIVFTITTLPIIDLLPSIPLFSSITPLLGLVTLVGYLFQFKKGPQNWNKGLNVVYLLGIVYVFWVFLSNPNAALLSGDRNWLFTFVQLWVMMLLSGELLKTPEKQKTAILVFAMAAMVSALFAIIRGDIAEDALNSARIAGLATNANQAARYFVVAMVFFYYLRIKTEAPFAKLLFLIGIIVTFLGVFFTVSRSGILLLFGAVGLIFILRSKIKQRVGLILLVVMGLFILSLFSDSIFRIIQGIFPAISEGTDTVGLRYNLWRAGWRMWLDYPVQGIGIGNYNSNLWRYMFDMAGPTRGSASSHNTFVQVLSETGIIGFIIFMAMLINAFKHFWPSKHKPVDGDEDLRDMWFIILMVITVGGVTITDLANKLLWMVMGISVIYGSPRSVTEEVSQENQVDNKRIYSKLSCSRFSHKRSWQK